MAARGAFLAPVLVPVSSCFVSLPPAFVQTFLGGPELVRLVDFQQIIYLPKQLFDPNFYFNYLLFCCRWGLGRRYWSCRGRRWTDTCSACASGGSADSSRTERCAGLYDTDERR